MLPMKLLHCAVGSIPIRDFGLFSQFLHAFEKKISLTSYLSPLHIFTILTVVVNLEDVTAN